MSDEFKEKWISGVWRRVGALVVDTVVLGITGAALGLVFANQFMAMGNKAQLAGFTIALAYFSVLNSGIGKGQTLGKRLFNIRVVNRANQYISWARAVVRYAILAVPYAVSDITTLANPNPTISSYVLSVIGLGGTLAIVYLIVFNRGTRQSLHDILTGTYVVYADASPQPVKDVWRTHYIVVAILLSIALFAPKLTGILAEREPFKELFSLRLLIVEQPEIKNAAITINHTVFTDQGERQGQTFVDVEAFVLSKVFANEQVAFQIAEIMHNSYSEAEEVEAYRVVLTYGYDMGIWSYWVNRNFTYTPNQIAEGSNKP